MGTGSWTRCLFLGGAAAGMCSRRLLRQDHVCLRCMLLAAGEPVCREQWHQVCMDGRCSLTNALSRYLCCAGPQLWQNTASGAKLQLTDLPLK